MPDVTAAVDNIVLPLIGAGQNLLRRTQMSHVRDSELPKHISSWISSAISQLLAIMPRESPDYTKIEELGSRYTNSQDILLLSSGDDIRMVLKNLRIARDYMTAAMNAEPRDIPPENLARVYFEQLKQSVDYVKGALVGQLMGKEDGRTRRTAVLHIYGRIYLWITSMVKLDEIGDCLALAGCLRAILELYIDLKLITASAIPDDVEKYFSFERSDKWRKAKSIVANRNRLGFAGDGSPRAIDEYIGQAGDEESNVRTLRERLWGVDKKRNPRNPKHWTDKSIVERVELLKDDRALVEIYDASYYYCNSLVHSMYSDWINNAGNVHLFNWHLYTLGNQMFVAATRLANDIAAGIASEDLEARIRQIHERTLKAYIGELAGTGRDRSGKG